MAGLTDVWGATGNVSERRGGWGGGRNRTAPKYYVSHQEIHHCACFSGAGSVRRRYLSGVSAAAGGFPGTTVVDMA